MKSNEREQAFVDRVRGVLLESEAQTDARVKMRLQSARLKALDAAQDPAPWYERFPRWITASGVATAVVLVASVTLWVSTEQWNRPSDQMDELEILTTKEQLDMYKDLEFYRWLETPEHAG